jgi:hypothetical protein
VGGEIRELQLCCAIRLDHGADPFPETRIRNAHDHSVADIRMGLERLLDLFREDLFAARVDAL